MKNTLKVLVVVAALVSIAAVSFGQAAGPQGGVAKGQAGKGGRGAGGAGGGWMAGGKRMQEVETKVLDKIGASADQKKKIASLRESQQKELMALMEKNRPATTPTPGERPKLSPELRDKVMAMQKSNQEKVKSILGDKFPAYEQGMRDAMKAMAEQGKGGKAAGGAKPGLKKGGAGAPPQA
jgi:hypothetical protein